MTLTQQLNKFKIKHNFCVVDSTHIANQLLDIRPSGFLVGQFNNGDMHSVDAKDHDKKIYASAMSMATMPGKQLMMTAFMLWMSGTTLQVFSIMMLGMAFWTPLTHIFGVNQHFIRFKDSNVDLMVPKLIYVALNCLAIAIASYKAHTMGLLPTYSDLLAPTLVRKSLELSISS